MKGMLERGVSVKMWFGEFHDLENEMLKMIAAPVPDFEKVLSDINKKKAVLVRNKIQCLGVETENLRRTIDNKKREVQSNVDEDSYLKWKEYVDRCALDFKIMFSNEANSMFDHYYKVDRASERVFMKISSSTNGMIRDVCVPFF